MNSYGDPYSAHGRGQYPDGAGDPDSGANDPYRRRGSDGAGGSGSGGWSAGSAGGQSGGAGRAQVRPSSGSGRASVGSAGAGGRASVGSASVGGSASAPTGRARASVPGSPGAGGSVPGGGSGGYGSTGRASVGSASVGAASVGAASAGAAAAGRASARASVRPVSPGGPGAGGPGGAGGGRRNRTDPEAARRAKRRKRINLIIASFAVLIMAAGVGVVGFTYYATTVPEPGDVKLPEASSIYASDGKSQLAKLGDQNRIIIPIKDVPKYVQYAVAAAEDRKFYEHSGVDYVGIARAAWNNFTGGSKQGASTITQQYARNAYENLEGVTYARKVREAVLASKLNDKYSKDQIMENYLNTIYFGRGAYGIEAAAQAYFSKSTNKLTLAEAAVLAGVIKQPEGTDSFDPAVNLEGSKGRWDYVLNGMQDKGWLQETQQQRPTEFPKFNPLPKAGECIRDCGANTPQGNVINYVVAEMAQKGLCKPENCSTVLREGGYKITTTIDNKMQKAAVNAASKQVKGSELYGKAKNLMAALVAIDPKTGGVLAYYGGENGTGTDFAGKNVDPKTGAVTGGHPPGSSFKVYTLAAALDENISLKSIWKTDKFKPEGVPYTVRNAGASDESISCRNHCTLEQSTIKSLNVPFYYVTDKIGPAKVLHMAQQAGVTTMWDNKGKVHDLTKSKPEDLAPEVFDKVLGYGQYGITVLDHANGLATLANGGKYNKAHFIKKIEQKNATTGKWEQREGEQLKPRQTIRPEVVDDVSATLAQIPPNNSDSLDGGRPAAGKTGTWELAGDSSDNAHAWMVGYTPQIATAVWIGNEGAEKAIKDGNKAMSGSGLPAEVWKRFMNAALKDKKVEKFRDAKFIGDDQAGNGEQPPPTPTGPGACPEDPTGLTCPRGGGNNGGGNNGGGTTNPWRPGGDPTSPPPD